MKFKKGMLSFVVNRGIRFVLKDGDESTKCLYVNESRKDFKFVQNFLTNNLRVYKIYYRGEKQ